jgi:hypothetical protein
MKITFAAAKVAVIAAALLGLFAGSALATAGTPVQGIPIGLDHDPGGNLAAKTTTGRDGKFVFANLEVGTYTLSAKSPTRTANIKFSGLKVVNGDVSSSTGASAKIKITKKGGRISGMIINGAPKRAGIPVAAGDVNGDGRLNAKQQATGAAATQRDGQKRGAAKDLKQDFTLDPKTGDKVPVK